MAERPAAHREPVTVTIARRVAPGREAEFEAFSSALTRAATTHPGFLGAGMLRPVGLLDDRVGDHGAPRRDAGQQAQSVGREHARRAVEKNALRHARAQLREATRVAQEVDDLLQLSRGVVDAGNVSPGDRGLRGRLHLGRPNARHQRKRLPVQEDDQPEKDQGQPRERDPGRSLMKSASQSTRQSHRQAARKPEGPRYSTSSSLGRTS